MQAESWGEVGKLVLVWLLVLVAGAGVSHLVARGALGRGIGVWRR